MKFVFLDFEFSGASNRDYSLICAVAIVREEGRETDRRRFWLADGSDTDAAKAFFTEKIKAGFTFSSFNFEVECRALMTLLGREIPSFPGGVIDLYLEWLQLTNKNDKACYGEQYVGGEVIRTTPPRSKWDETPDVEGQNHKAAGKGLAAALYKMCGVKIDTEHKDAMRDICIRNDPAEVAKNRKYILDYCESDVEHLRNLLVRIMTNWPWQGFSVPMWMEWAKLRGEYAVATAKMVRHGYPIDYDGLKAFDRNVVKLLAAAAKDCNEASAPEGLTPFLIGKDGTTIRQQQKIIKTWVAAKYPEWPRTDKGQISLDRKAVSRYFQDTDPGFAGSYRRFKSIEESIRGFGVKGGKKSFFDHVGTDKRVRHHHGIYGSVTARSQHGSTGFLPAKSKWMKAGLQAPPGFALVELDYSQQEYLIQACISGDEKMRDSYDSGDAYLTFAIAAGLAPPTATKKSHKRERDIAKALVLGIGYDKGPAALAAEITANGTPMTRDEAAALIDKFYKTYSRYAQFKRDTQEKYRAERRLQLIDGWCLWGDNLNFRSVGNFPIQGSGSVILRSAVKLAQRRGLKILYTMHDSITMEMPSNDFSQIELLKRVMIETFRGLTKKHFPLEGNIRVSGEAWSLDYNPIPAGKIQDVEFLPRYVTEGTKQKWELYGKYFRDM